MQVKVASPEESGRIVAYDENVYFSFPKEIKTEGVQSYENAKCRVVLWN